MRKVEIGRVAAEEKAAEVSSERERDTERIVRRGIEGKSRREGDTEREGERQRATKSETERR